MAENDPAKPRARRASAGKSPPPPTPKRVRAKLVTINDVTRELGRLYREARGRKIDTADASKLANILATMGRLIEGSELERRLSEIEARLKKENHPWPAKHH